MNIKNFTKLFAEQFEDSDDVNFKSSTVFKDLDEWSSIMSLIILTMIKDNYNATINAEEIKNANTIDDLYKLVLSKK